MTNQTKTDGNLKKIQVEIKSPIQKLNLGTF